MSLILIKKKLKYILYNYLFIMIKTNLYNDFSDFSWEQKRDFDFLMNSILEFHTNGGDLSLPVKIGSSIDSFSLVSLDSFIKENIDEHVKFNEQLIKKGVLPGFCDFTYDKKTNTIIENKQHPISWMRSNFNDYSEIILASIQRLLNQLPNDYNQVKTLTGVDFYQKETILASTESVRSFNPIFFIAEQLKESSVYELIFKKYPTIKQEWMKADPRKDDKPIFLSSIDSTHSDIRNPELGIFFFKNEIGQDYFSDPQNSNKAHDLIKYASYSGDKDFLNLILPKVNLSEIEKGLYDYELSISKAKDKETIKILLENGASFKHEVLRNSNKYEVNLLYSREASNAIVVDGILENKPEEIVEFKKNYDFLYHNLEYKDFSLTKLVVSKYDFPLENYDMLYVAKKQNKKESTDTDLYEWLVKNGADIRRCDKFCKAVVDSREDGLKLLRALNKKGIIVSKSSDIVFNILRSNPTKTFLNYYEKITNTEIEKYNINGYPAWWGATNISDFKWAISKTDNIEQKAQHQEPYFVFALREELFVHKFSARGLIEEQLKVAKKRNPNLDLDFSYRDKYNNNFLHFLFATEKYKKDSIDSNILDVLQSNSSQNVFASLMEKNQQGKSPLDILLTQEYRNSWGLNPVLAKIVREAGDFIDWNKQILDTGKTAKDIFLENFENDSKIKVEIQALALEQKLNAKEAQVSKKFKL